MIPRIVHQTEENWATLPDNIKATMKGLRHKNKDFDFRYYDANQRRQYISDHYGSNFLAAYDALDPLYGAARADLFRYCVVLRSGGIYIDAKSSIKEPLTRITDGHENLVVSPPEAFNCIGFRAIQISQIRMKNRNLISQSFFAAPQNDPMLAFILKTATDKIDKYIPHKDGLGAVGVFNITGPKMFTRAIVCSPQEMNISFVTSNEIGFEFSGGLPREAVRLSNRRHYSCLLNDVVLKEYNNTPFRALSRVVALAKYGPEIILKRWKVAKSG